MKYFNVAKACSSVVKATENFLFGQGERAQDTSFIRKNTTYWNTSEGIARLFSASCNKDFFRLAHNYQPKINPFYSSVACMVIALNTFRLEKGAVPNQVGFDYRDMDDVPHGRHVPYNMYSQLTLLNEETEKIKPKQDIAPSLRLGEGKKRDYNPGLNLFQMREILKIYGVFCELKSALEDEEKGLHHFREDLRDALQTAEKLMIINFAGEKTGTGTGGHYALAAAYDDESDNLLIMDTTCEIHPWYWVPAPQMYSAMHTKTEHGKRGYLIISDSL